MSIGTKKERILKSSEIDIMAKFTQCIAAFKRAVVFLIMMTMVLKFLIYLTPLPVENLRSKLTFDFKNIPVIFESNIGSSHTDLGKVTPLTELISADDKSSADNMHRHGNSNYVTLTFPRNRLGNQMFQVASLIGISATYNYVPAISVENFKDIFQVFKEPSEISNSISINPGNIYKEPDADLFKERDITQFSDVEILRQTGNWTIDGYFQSYKHFNHVPKSVKKFFTFKDEYIGKAREFMQHHNLSDTVVIGMHIRRGDFLSEYHQSLGRTTVDEDYVQRAMDFYRAWYKTNIAFVVMSNDVDWCKTNIKDPKNPVVFSTFDHPGYDLALMSLCDHMIMSVGTFGWWGGWLSGGHVIYFNGYPRPGSELDKYFNKEDFYPPEWTPML